MDKKQANWPIIIPYRPRLVSILFLALFCLCISYVLLMVFRDEKGLLALVGALLCLVCACFILRNLKFHFSGCHEMTLFQDHAQLLSGDLNNPMPTHIEYTNINSIELSKPDDREIEIIIEMGNGFRYSCSSCHIGALNIKRMYKIISNALLDFGCYQRVKYSMVDRINIFKDRPARRVEKIPFEQTLGR